MLSVVCWKWAPPKGYRSSFGPETVNTLAAMIRRHYHKPVRIICVTDDPAGIAPGIEIIPLWDQHGDLPNPSGPSNPSCYRRLKMFSRDAGQMFGPRFVSLDLDCVITGDLSPLWDRPEDVVLWSDTNPRTFYNGSMILMTAGARPQVWDEFDPRRSPGIAKGAGQFGSDQAWISYRLGAGEATWGVKDGVYSYRNHVRTSGGALPAGARIVLFHGRTDPWGPEARRISWVREHYRGADVDVEAVNLAGRFVLLTDGRTVPITNLFDGHGDETAELDDVVSFVAGEGQQWFAAPMRKFERAVTQ